MNNALDKIALNDEAIHQSLMQPSAYVHSVHEPVVLHDTHISWVLLAGHFAYKIKKPIVTDFLDYSTLANRHHCCCEELRLGNRYAPGLYLDVVPITFEDGQFEMDGDAQPIDFAVRMRRFEDDALLSTQLAKNLISAGDMVQLAAAIAGFHAVASKQDPAQLTAAERVLDQAQQNLDFLIREPVMSHDSMLPQLQAWTTDYFAEHRQNFQDRIDHGFIRECHGDLHCSNIVHWREHWVPFDGIEFNCEYSWIDVASDIAFLVMDLQERGHSELSAIFLNAYLEQTGDFQALKVLRWYMVYRALVRAKVAFMLARQRGSSGELDADQLATAQMYVRLADRLSKPGRRQLWITHGVSGSGKTTGSLLVVQREGAIRVRSDVERKRLYKTSMAGQSALEIGKGIYAPTATQATYNRLAQLAKSILQSDFSVVADATFLKRADRLRFHELAHAERADFHILDFQADEETLRERITERSRQNNDASDATLAILANQLSTQEPLTREELQVTIFQD